MNARYQPTRRSMRLLAAVAATLTAVLLFETVASLGETPGAAAADARAGVMHMASASNGTASMLLQ